MINSPTPDLDDDLLNSALDDLEEEEQSRVNPSTTPHTTITHTDADKKDNGHHSTTNNNKDKASNGSTKNNNNNNNKNNNNNTNINHSTNNVDDFSEQFASEMRLLMSALENGDIEKTIQGVQNMYANPPSGSSSDSSPAQFEDNIANTLKMLAENAKNMENTADDDMDKAGLDKLMEQFENNKDLQSAMEGMVQQLISKDIMYDPMRELREKYPAWLKENEKKLPEEEFRRYIKQYECVQKICNSYESNSEALQDVIQLMQEMADCGQPPPEIMQDLASGVQFGADGMPVLPGQDGSNPNCSIM